MSISQSSSPLAVLADLPVNQMDANSMEYFLIEMVATLKESAAVATARNKKIEQEMLEAGLMPPPAPVPTALKRDSARDSVTSLLSRTGGASVKAPIDEEEEPVRQRLEAIGMHVGANFSERCASTL
jgi:hypothetical protein